MLSVIFGIAQVKLGDLATFLSHLHSTQITFVCSKTGFAP
jgi:hypothetical protein